MLSSPTVFPFFLAHPFCSIILHHIPWSTHYIVDCMRIKMLTFLLCLLYSTRTYNTSTLLVPTTHLLYSYLQHIYSTRTYNTYTLLVPTTHLLYSYLQHIYSTRTYNTVASSELESFPLEDDRFCHWFRITSVCKSRCQRSVPENAKLEFGAWSKVNKLLCCLSTYAKPHV